MSTTNAVMTYYTTGSEAVRIQPSRTLVLIDGGRDVRSPQSPRTYHEQATSKGHRVLTTSQGILAFCLALAVFVSVLSAGLVRDLKIVEARNEALAGIAVEEVVVQPGDSLWQIAEAHPVAGVSTPDLVSYISETNSLPNANLNVGQHLLVPAA